MKLPTFPLNVTLCQNSIVYPNKELGWVEFYKYEKFKDVKIYFLDKNWTFNIVCITKAATF